MAKGYAAGKTCSGYLGCTPISRGYSGVRPSSYSLFSKPYGKIEVGYKPFQMFQRNNGYRNMAPAYSDKIKYGAKSKPVRNYSSKPNLNPKPKYQNKNRSIDVLAQASGGYFPGKEYAAEALKNAQPYAPSAPDIGDLLQQFNPEDSYFNKAKCPLCGKHPLKCLCNPLQN